MNQTPTDLRSQAEAKRSEAAALRAEASDLDKEAWTHRAEEVVESASDDKFGSLISGDRARSAKSDARDKERQAESVEDEARALDRQADQLEAEMLADADNKDREAAATATNGDDATAGEMSREADELRRTARNG